MKQSRREVRSRHLSLLTLSLRSMGLKKHQKRGLSRHAAARQRVHRARPLHHRIALHPTSIFLLLVAGVLMVGWTVRVTADTYTVTGKIPAPPLTEGAVITSPTDGDMTSTGTVTVRGTCPDDSYVKLTRNGVFSGVSWCATNTFTIDSALSPGLNTLQAQDYNITDDAGPITPPVSITYTPPPSPPAPSTSHGTSNSGGSSNTPLLLTSDYSFHGYETGSNFNWVITIKGGTAPYRLSISWGDNQTSKDIAAEAGDFTISHEYDDAGYYPIIIQVTDDASNTTILQIMAFIKTAGSRVIFNTTERSTPLSNLLLDTLSASRWLLIAWPFYLIIVLMTISFWLGERQMRLQAAHDLVVVRSPRSRRRM